VETVATAPEPVPTVDTSADDDQDEEPAPSPPPAPPPLAKTSAPANDDEASVTVTLAGEPARQLLSLIAHLASALRGTGARISPSSLVEDLIEREHASIVGKAVAA
jgi:hypothetical protein